MKTKMRDLPVYIRVPTALAMFLICLIGGLLLVIGISIAVPVIIIGYPELLDSGRERKLNLYD